MKKKKKVEDVQEALKPGLFFKQNSRRLMLVMLIETTTMMMLMMMKVQNGHILYKNKFILVKIRNDIFLFKICPKIKYSDCM